MMTLALVIGMAACQHGARGRHTPPPGVLLEQARVHLAEGRYAQSRKRLDILLREYASSPEAAQAGQMRIEIAAAEARMLAGKEAERERLAADFTQIRDDARKGTRLQARSDPAAPAGSSIILYAFRPDGCTIPRELRLRVSRRPAKSDAVPAAPSAPLLIFSGDNHEIRYLPPLQAAGASADDLRVWMDAPLDTVSKDAIRLLMAPGTSSLKIETPDGTETVAISEAQKSAFTEIIAGYTAMGGASPWTTPGMPPQAAAAPLPGEIPPWRAGEILRLEPDGLAARRYAHAGGWVIVKIHEIPSPASRILIMSDSSYAELRTQWIAGSGFLTTHSYPAKFVQGKAVNDNILLSESPLPVGTLIIALLGGRGLTLARLTVESRIEEPSINALR